MQNCLFFLGASFLLLLLIFLLGGHHGPLQLPTANALYYNNRNECNSIKVNYEFRFEKDQYVLKQDMTLRPTRSVTECFFYMDMDFQLFQAELKVNEQKQGVILEFMPSYFVVRIMNGSWLQDAIHDISFKARRPFKKTDEGIVFRTFRHPESLVK